MSRDDGVQAQLPGPRRGTVAAEAEIVSITRTTAVVRIQVENDGRVACIAQGTVLIRDPRP